MCILGRRGKEEGGGGGGGEYSDFKLFYEMPICVGTYCHYNNYCRPIALQSRCVELLCCVCVCVCVCVFMFVYMYMVHERVTSGFTQECVLRTL